MAKEILLTLRPSVSDTVDKDLVLSVLHEALEEYAYKRIADPNHRDFHRTDLAGCLAHAIRSHYTDGGSTARYEEMP
jgi:hypothetical protein